MTGSERIPTNLRLLLIMEVVGLSDRALTASEINEQIGLPKQSLHRLVLSLVSEGFLIREDGGKRFRPSRRARQMGSGLLYASRTHMARHQILQDVARQVKETVNYVVPEDTGMHYLDRIETDWPFRIQLPIGTNVPFHCTASGKAFMASLAPAVRQRFVGGLNLDALTRNTLAEPGALMDELKRTARRGYALDNEEFMEDMVAVAVPVTDPKGRYIASLAFHGPKQRLTLQGAEAQRSVLIAAAQRLRESLFDDPF